MTENQRAPFGETQFQDGRLQEVWNALNRGMTLQAMRELHNGLDKARRPDLGAEVKLAFGFDTNAIFRLGVGKPGPDIIDFLSQKQKGPVIVPGQAIQEVWNNFLVGVEPKSRAVAKKLSELETSLATIGQELGAHGEAATTALEALITSHGDWTDEKALSEFDSALQALLAVSTVSYVPRDEFYRLGLVRRETKTPPGFRDDAHNFGDYFIWADFLFGLATADLSEIDAVIFVTDDKKKDWSTNQIPHPILVAEARAVSGKDFRLWTLDKFRAYVKTIAT